MAFMQSTDVSSEARALKDEILTLAYKVQKVHINGLNRTKDDYVIENVKEVFSVTDFGQLISKVNSSVEKLKSVGCFKKVVATIDACSGPDATLNDVEVSFEVVEVGPVGARVSTGFGQNEGSMSCKGILRNFFGRGEEVIADFTKGMNEKTSYSFHGTKKLSSDFGLLGRLYKDNNEIPWASYKQEDKGIDFGYYWMPAHQVKQEIKGAGVWRHLSCLNKDSPFSVREQSGPDLKMSLVHLLETDTRDCTILPSSGYHLKFNTEMAGGSVNFLKNDFQFSSCAPIPFVSMQGGDIVSQVCIAGGHLHPLNPSCPPNLNDKFFVGGSNTMRGFEMAGMGPQNEGTAMGTTSYLIAGVHLFSPLPLLPQNGFTDKFRLHMWSNFGNAADAQGNIPKSVRMSYGLGLAYNLFGKARVELNYSVPFSNVPGDRVKNGLQFGLSVESL